MSNDKIWNGDRVETKLEGKYINNQSPNSMVGEQTIQGDNIQGNKIVNNSQNLVQAAQDIKALITQLSNDYDTTTPTGKRKLSDRILETLEGESTIQKRALNAIKAAGKTAFEEAIDHPVTKVLVAGLESDLEG